MKKFQVINIVCFTALVLINSVYAEDELKLVYRVFDECTNNGVDTSTCLKLKLLSAMERASRSRDLEIMDGIHLVGEERKIGTAEETPYMENEIEANLPRSLDDREKALDNMIVNKATNFIETRAVQFKLASLSDIPRSLVGEEEGRGRRRRIAGLVFLMMMMIAGTLIPLKLGALALLAGKALIISKLALALAAIVGLKKLISGGHEEHESSYQVVQVPHGHHKRSIPSSLPYRAHIPTTN